jgi:hypothetical protein
VTAFFFPARAVILSYRIINQNRRILMMAKTNNSLIIHRRRVVDHVVYSNLGQQSNIFFSSSLDLLMFQP